MSIWERNELRWRDAGGARRTSIATASASVIRAECPRSCIDGRGWTASSCAATRALSRPRSLGRAANAAIAYVFHPMFWPYVEALPSCRVVYHADDRFAAMPGSGPEIAGFERALCERADRIFAITPGVANGLPRCAAGKTVLVPNGADADAYERGSRSPVPALLADVPRPRIAYAGSLNEKDRLRARQSTRVRTARHPLAADRLHPRRGANEPRNPSAARRMPTAAERALPGHRRLQRAAGAFVRTSMRTRCSIERTATGGGATSIR